MAALHHRTLNSSAGASVAGNAVTQLEFHQAMSDFKVMFPAVEADVIECVLRSNNGAVDATIDQLLQMASDLEQANPQPALPPAATAAAAVPSSIAGSSFTPSSASQASGRGQLICLDDEDEESDPPPPSYHQAVPASSASDPPAAAPTASRVKDCNLQTAAAAAAAASSSGILPAPGGNILVRKVSNNSLRARFKWSPPLLSPLPDSFLRFPDPSLNRMHGLQYRASNTAARQRPTPDRLNNSRPVSVLSSTLLQQKMQENELKRQSTDDPGASQMLDDERLAILLQNEEFVRELRNNQDFMSQLQRDAGRSGDERDGASGSASGGSSNFSDAAFREMLKNMSKVSRKKFAQVAGMFSRRRRFKSDGSGGGPLGSPTQRHMSKDHLLSGKEDEYRALENDSSDSEDRHSPYRTTDRRRNQQSQQQPQPQQQEEDDPFAVGIRSPYRSGSRDAGSSGFRL